MSNLLTRALTGAVFVSIVIGSILLDPYAMIVVFALFMFLGLNEYFQLFKKHEHVSVNKEIGLFIGAFIFIVLVGISLEWLPVASVALVFPLFFLLILTELWRKKLHPLLNISVLVFGVIYVTLPFFLVIDLNLRNEAQLPTVVGMFILIWANDSFAYLSGRAFGKHKLFERISPKKTWEGTFGGVIATVLLGYLIGSYINEDTFFWVISALIIAPCAVYGDLLESLFKRSLNIKDTGTILPGHGGILDRFDAALFAIPFFYCWTIIYTYF
jgi:phosphatidate cytidylyltransferase